jgi:hypothetical protein
MNDNGIALMVLSLISASAQGLSDRHRAPRPHGQRRPRRGRAAEPVPLRRHGGPEHARSGASRLRAAALHDAEARLRRLHAERLSVRGGRRQHDAVLRLTGVRRLLGGGGGVGCAGVSIRAARRH